LSTRQPRIYTTVIQKTKTDIYLSGSIDEPEDYLNELQVLNEAEPDDEIRIRINSPGGTFFVAQQIVNAIRNCKGTVIGVLEGISHSAATLVLLACDSWEVNPGVFLMVHTYSGGSYGKGLELLLSVQAQHDWITNVMRETYEGFLTPEEMVMIEEHGKDLWMETDEILRRLNNVATLRNLRKQEEEELAQEAALTQLMELVQDDRQDCAGDSERSTEL